MFDVKKRCFYFFFNVQFCVVLSSKVLAAFVKIAKQIFQNIKIIVSLNGSFTQMQKSVLLQVSFDKKGKP